MIGNTKEHIIKTKYRDIDQLNAKHKAINKNNSGHIKSKHFNIYIPTTELLPSAFNSLAVS